MLQKPRKYTKPVFPNGHHLTKYPFNRMVVGESIGLHFDSKGEAVRARIAAHTFGCYSDRKFKTSINGATLEVRRIV